MRKASVLLAGVLFLAGACKKEKASVSNPPSACIQVVDKQTQQPLPGVYMEYFQGSGWLAYNSLNATTDSNGKMCTDPGDYTSVRLSKNGYVTETFNQSLSSRVEMQMLAYVRVHLKNQPPASNDDHINIKCRPENTFLIGDDFWGILDTTITREVDPRVGYITWTATGVISAQTVNYTAAGAQTVDVYINY